MNQTPNTTDHTLLLVLFAVFVFHSPFSRWWLGQQPPWYSIFVIWGIILLLVALNQWRIKRRRG